MPGIIADHAAAFSILGLTPSEASALGALIGGIIVAFLGLKRGDDARKSIPPDPAYSLIGAALVDHDTMRDLVAAVEDLTGAIHKMIESRERTEVRQVSDRLEDLARQIDEKIERGPTRR